MKANMQTILTFIAMTFAITSGGLVAQEIAQELQTIADKAIQKGETPGIIVAIVRDADDVDTAVAGRRKWDDETLLTVDDQMHLGSCTKAFTAVLAARLVKKGAINWDSTIAEILPRLKLRIHRDYHGITLEQLLHHTSGLPRDAVNWWTGQNKSPSKARELILKESLAEEPARPAGEKYEYSNLGYMIAGLMLAKASSQSWEEAMDKEVFQPLGLTTAGFGIPGEIGSVEQPWGHIKRKDGKYAAMQIDNSPALGPAGTIHLSISDWARFVSIFLGDMPDDFLTQESLDRLQTPSRIHKYCLGWRVYSRTWGKGKVLNHSGSNRFWYCNVWVAPNTGRAYLVNLNCGSQEVIQQTDEILAEIVKLDRSK